MAERYFHAYCVDMASKTMKSALLPASEMQRILNHGGLLKTPPPLTLLWEGVDMDKDLDMTDIMVLVAKSKDANIRIPGMPE